MIQNPDIERLFRSSHKRLWSALQRRCKGLREDDTQEAYLALCMNRTALRDKASLEGYFLAVAFNKYRERLRSTKDHQQLVEVLELEGESSNTEAVRQAARELEPDLRAVVEKFLEGLSIEQTASSLGIPEGTVKSRMHRAKAKLRVKLNPLYRLGAL